MRLRQGRVTASSDDKGRGMDEALTIIWWLAAATGITAVVISLVRPEARRAALLAGAGAFAVAGVLGILSIGIIFLVAAVVCGVLAARQFSSDRANRAIN